MVKNLNSLVIGAIVFSLVGCGTVTRRTSKPSRPTPPTSAEPIYQRPPVDFSDGEPPQSIKPKPTPKIGLILGPGGFKAFAHAGVLKELQKARIPIQSIVGMEWGSLVAALYAQKAQVPDVEWKLYKLERRDLPGKSFFSDQLKAEPVSSLKSFFNDSFSDIAIANGAVSFACPTQSLVTGVVQFLDRGSYAQALSRCLPFPPLFRAQELWMADTSSLAAAANYLRQRGAELIVFVNVLGDGELFERSQLLDGAASAILWQESRRQLLREKGKGIEWIEVETSRMNVLDFDKRKELVRAGEMAGEKAAAMLVNKYGY